MSKSFNEKLVKFKVDRAQKAILSGGKTPQGEILGSGAANRHGMPKLPPGQHEVKNWPVLDLGIQPSISKDAWKLKVEGEVENPFVLNWKDFMALPQMKDTSDFHCVTTWSLMDSRWEGVQFKVLAENAKLKPTAKYVLMTGADGYSVNLKLEEALDDDVLLVHKWNGQDLPREHGGPVRLITPKKYAWKGSKWIDGIIFLPEDKLGFWEVRGYSNTAEPWYEDRYAEPNF